eukprot:scaffold2849_cov121-Isochrysis_galbana.AAC.1
MALGSWARRNAVASATIGALATLLLLAEWRLGHSRRALDAALQKLVVEQQHGLKLRRKIKRFGEHGGAQPQPPTLLSSTGNGSAISASELLEGHRRWDWRAIATDFLQRWPSIESQQLETAVETCANNGTMYCQRLQVHPIHSAGTCPRGARPHHGGPAPPCAAWGKLACPCSPAPACPLPPPHPLFNGRRCTVARCT